MAVCKSWYRRIGIAGATLLMVGRFLDQAPFCQAQPSNALTVGPAKGALVIVGGGGMPKQLWERFIELAGGPEREYVVIPTGGEDDDYNDQAIPKPLKDAGITKITLLHTRDREVADSAEFVKPLQSASGVWIGGGRQWRIADAMLDTRTHRELEALLERGGVVGGSSAGATIQGSYLVRGDTRSNLIMMSPGHERGFGFLRNSAIDQHLLTRKREKDMLPVIEKHPELLGLGIDEATAVVVRGNRLEVLGRSKVAIYNSAEPIDEPYFFLEAGERFDLKSRRRIKTRQVVESK